MEPILKAVRAARGRLLLQVFLQSLVRSGFWTAWAACALILAIRAGACPAWVAFILPAAWLGGAIALTMARRPTMRSAALALDLFCGLKERLSAALYIAQEQSEIADAIVRDAQEALLRSGPRSLPVVRPRLTPLLAPVAVALLCLLIPGMALTPADAATAADDTSPPVPEAVRKDASEKMQRLAFALERKMSAENDPELKALIERMREAATELRKQDMTRTEALATLSRLEDELRERRQDVEKKVPDGVSAPRVDEGGWNRGDEKALQEKARKLAALKDKLAAAVKEVENALDAETQEAREQALRELGETLRDLATAADLPESLRAQLKNAMGETGDLSSLDREALRELMEALQGEQGEFGELGDLSDMNEYLESEWEQLLAMKDMLAESGSSCWGCGTELEPGDFWCEGCEGRLGANGVEPGLGDGGGDGAGNGGGPGRGPDGAADPEDPRAPTKVSGRLHPGDIIGAIKYKGRPKPGEVKTGYAEAYAAMAAEAADALEREDVPPAYRRVVRDYFDSIRPDKEK